MSYCKTSVLSPLGWGACDLPVLNGKCPNGHWDQGQGEDVAEWGEPAPVPNDRPSIHDLVTRDMESRKAFGLAKYGTILQAGNGRKALKDAYEEVLDLAVYLRQALEEQREREVPSLDEVREAFTVAACPANVEEKYDPESGIKSVHALIRRWARGQR